MAGINAAEQRGATVSLKHLIKLRAQARGLTLKAGKKVATAMAGQYTSSFRGRGMDFDEVRIYQPGDDIRAMDWRVTARTGQPHTKLFREERERPVFFLVDQSPTMQFGTRGAFKSVIAAEMAALLAWASSDSGDRIGGLVFSGSRHVELRPVSGQRGVIHLLKTITERPPAETPGHSGAMDQALARLRHVTRPGSMIVLLSDFRQLGDEGERHLGYLAQHNDILAVFIYDALEANLPPPGRYNVSDGRQIVAIDTVQAGRRDHYRERFQARRHQVERLFRRRGVSLLEMATHQPVAETLSALLGGRRR